jgi:hypothetical protein
MNKTKKRREQEETKEIEPRKSSRIKFKSAKYSNSCQINICDAISALVSGEYYDKSFEQFNINVFHQSDSNTLIVKEGDIQAFKMQITNDSPTIEEARTSSDWPLWLKAMQEELKKLISLCTWNIVTSLPPGRRPIQYKWVLKIKKDMFNKMIFKARLTSKGYTQKFGIDFEDTFSPVARFTSVRLVFSIGVQNGWIFWVFDVESAFPNAKLPEDIDIYMIPPEELKLPPGSFLRLRNALYGLKQASREWNLLITGFLISIGFLKLISDSCIFKIKRNNTIMILVLYVDDMIVCTNSHDNIHWLRDQLKSQYKIKDSPLERCLGVETEYDINKRILKISKNDYIKNLVIKYNHLIQDIPTRVTPMTEGLKLSRDDCPRSEKEKLQMSEIPYREIIGALNYLTNIIRPDISFAVNYLARFMDNPGRIHWTHLLNILAYLRDNSESHITYGILKGMSPNTLYVFVDSDHATTDLDNRRSVTGYLIFYNGGLISWKTQLQKSNSSSSTESEYKAIHEAGKESLWISNILFELDLPLSKPIVIFEDNNSSINATENPVQHSRLKHIDIIYHQVRSWKEENRITLIHIPREKQIADSMNKASIKKDFLNFRSKIMTMSR